MDILYMVIFYFFHLHALLETVKERTFCFPILARYQRLERGRERRIKQDQEMGEWRRERLKKGQKRKIGREEVNEKEKEKEGIGEGKEEKKERGKGRGREGKEVRRDGGMEEGRRGKSKCSKFMGIFNVPQLNELKVVFCLILLFSKMFLTETN